MEHKIDDFIRHALDAQPISGTSLIISLYGDALSHRGGEVWLGSLSALLEPLGFGDRFVRTSIFGCKRGMAGRHKIRPSQLLSRHRARHESVSSCRKQNLSQRTA